MEQDWFALSAYRIWTKGKTDNSRTPLFFALPLTAEYLKTVFNIPNYVQARIADNYNFYADEYSQTFPLSLPCPSFQPCSSLLLRPPCPSSSFRIGNR